jgi:menaquinone-9 beta-reductase
MSNSASYDVIIVGSGPAGASTALHLARLNPALARRTLVLERDRHPRHKLCGGGCVPDVDVCLQNLGLDYRRSPSVDVDWAKLHFQGRGFPLRFNQHSAFRVVRRDEFDHWLVNEARDRDITLQEETRVVRLRQCADGVEVETDRGTFVARVVVGADGSSSVVRRMVAGGADAGTVARLLEITTPELDEADGTRINGRDALLDFAWMPHGVQGYVWSFPTRCGGQAARNWGVYDSRLLARRSAGSLRPVLADWLAQHGYRLDDYRLEGHPIRLFDPRGVFSAPHLLLAGDAAGVDAVFGEGISLALGYGEIAAEAIHQAFAANDFSFADYRDRVLASPLGRALRRRTRAARLMQRLHHPLAQKLIWWRLGPAVRWYLNHFVFFWARPLAPPTATGTTVPDWHQKRRQAKKPISRKTIASGSTPARDNRGV